MRFREFESDVDALYRTAGRHVVAREGLNEQRVRAADQRMGRRHRRRAAGSGPLARKLVVITMVLLGLVVAGIVLFT